MVGVRMRAKDFLYAPCSGNGAFSEYCAMGCGQGAAASLGQNIGAKANYISRRYGEGYSKKWWSALKGCSMRLHDIADRPPILEHFYFLKGQVAELAPISEPRTFHITAMSDSMAAALPNQISSYQKVINISTCKAHAASSLFVWADGIFHS